MFYFPTSIQFAAVLQMFSDMFHFWKRVAHAVAVPPRSTRLRLITLFGRGLRKGSEASF